MGVKYKKDVLYIYWPPVMYGLSWAISLSLLVQTVVTLILRAFWQLVAWVLVGCHIDHKKENLHSHIHGLLPAFFALRLCACSALLNTKAVFIPSFLHSVICFTDLEGQVKVQSTSHAGYGLCRTLVHLKWLILAPMNECTSLAVEETWTLVSF